MARMPDAEHPGADLTFTCRLSQEDAAIQERLQEFLRLDSRAATVRFALREAARARNLLVEALPLAVRAGYR